MSTKQTAVDVVSGTLTYSGEADFGRAEGVPFWSLKKTAVAGTITTVKYPVGPGGMPTDKPIFRWDLRAQYDYSFTQDTTPPTFPTVTIASNNADTTLAKIGDTVTLTIIGSEPLKDGVVTIAGNPATLVAGVDDLHWTATYVMASGDASGVVPFSVSFTDLGGHAATPVTAVTGGASVTFDKTGATKVSESFATLNTLGAPGVGTFTMSEIIESGAVVSIVFIDSVTLLDLIGTISATGDGTTAVVSVTYTAPAVAPNPVKIKIVVTDLAGNNSASILSDAYVLS